jgi:hypothetical protein
MAKTTAVPLNAIIAIIFLGIVMLEGCNIRQQGEVIENATLTPAIEILPSVAATIVATTTPTEIATSTLTPTTSPTPTNTPTNTQTSTPTETPTETFTPTPEGVTVSAEQNINCRWGPHVKYLNAGLLPVGASAQVDGRDYAATWLWIQMEGIAYHCWVAGSAVALQGDIDSVPRVSIDPPINSAIQSAGGVSASRNGSKVTITWSAASPAVELHYLIRAYLCNGQYVIETIVSTQNTAITLQDKTGCSGTSSAQVFVVNKTGYASPVSVPWQ